MLPRLMCISLLKKLRELLTARIESISNPRFRRDVAGRAGVRLQFLSQVTDKNVQVLRTLSAVLAPNIGQQCAMRNDLAWTLCQIKKQVEFLWRQLHFTPFYLDGSRFRVDAEITNFDRICCLVGIHHGSPQSCADTRKQFVHTKWLSDVII